MTEEERAIDAYNRGAEANALRFEYFMKIMKAYDRFDFSELFDDLAGGCRWGGAHGKEDVIRSLKAGAESMRERDYRFSTAPDGAGRTVRAGLLYEPGEICMIDRTPLQKLFFRMRLSPDGKILDFYATLPPANYRPVY